MKRKVCIVTGTRAEWGLLSGIANELKHRVDVELQLVVTNMHLDERYGHTIDDIIARRVGENPEALHRNTNINHAGDIIFTITPGWSIEDTNQSSNNNLVVRAATPSAPVFILAPSVKAQKISYPVDARAIAPTVARLLRIRSPNSAATTPLQF